MLKTKYIRGADRLPDYMPYPRFLLSLDISQTARTVYMLLLDRATLSKKNGWSDEEGNIYVIYPLKEISKILGICLSSITRSFMELSKAGLIKRRHNGFNRPNIIFVMMPESDTSEPLDYHKMSNPDCEKTSNPDCEKTSNPDCEKMSSPDCEKMSNPDCEKMSNQTNKNVAPNKTTYSKTTDNKTTESINKSICTDSCMGKYRNIRLTEIEIKKLKRDMPDTWSGYIERLSEKIHLSGIDPKDHYAEIKCMFILDRSRARNCNFGRGIQDYHGQDYHGRDYHGQDYCGRDYHEQDYHGSDYFNFRPPRY